MVHYILQTIIFQLFFLIVFNLFLKKETFFNWNRVYLLGTMLLSLILPFIQIQYFKEVVPATYTIMFPEVVIGNLDTVTSFSETHTNAKTIVEPTGFRYLDFVFYFGAAIASVLFIYKLFYVLLLIKNNSKVPEGHVQVITLKNSKEAFSFFNYVFLGDGLTDYERDSIINHEKIHVAQNHTLDLLFFELLRIVFWFNPFVYMYQGAIQLVHEYQADSQALKQQTKQAYYQNLLLQVFNTRNISFINPFFKQSLIKKRIVMLQKSKSKQVSLLKYVMLVPMVLCMLVYTSSISQDKKLSRDYNMSHDTLDDKALFEKLEAEYDSMIAAGAESFKLAKAFLPTMHKYVYNKEEYYRLKVLYKKGWSDIFELRPNSSSHTNGYSAYLKYKNTNQAKYEWENDTSGGILKLFVNKLDNTSDIEKNNLSKREEESFKNKKKMFFSESNNIYSEFVITDGKQVVTLKRTDKAKVVTREPPATPSNGNNMNVVVPFAVIEEPPVFTDCDTLKTNKEKKDCVSRIITQFIAKNYNIEIADSLGLKGRQRISVVFKINDQGNITAARARGPHPALEAEAIRVVEALPKMIPGKQRGKAVTVPYAVPIVFQVAEASKETRQ